MPRKSTQPKTEIDPIEAEIQAQMAAQTRAATKTRVSGARPTTVKFDTAQGAKAYRLIRAAYPELLPDQGQIDAAGQGADGQSVLMFCVVREKGNGQPAANVKLYRSGKAVFVNVPAIDLPR